MTIIRDKGFEPFSKLYQEPQLAVMLFNYRYGPMEKMALFKVMPWCFYSLHQWCIQTVIAMDQLPPGTNTEALSSLVYIISLVSRVLSEIVLARILLSRLTIPDELYTATLTA